LTGVEGYVESAAAGLMAGKNAARVLAQETTLVFPRETVLGALAHYITTTDAKHFQPMNSNWALMPPLELPSREIEGSHLRRKKISKEEKAALFVARAEEALERFIDENALLNTTVGQAQAVTA
jgi:methylenetetrahydrofolate--tRNA-(uracil-5-)-methyltransferase